MVSSLPPKLLLPSSFSSFSLTHHHHHLLCCCAKKRSCAVGIFFFVFSATALFLLAFCSLTLDIQTLLFFPSSSSLSAASDYSLPSSIAHLWSYNNTSTPPPAHPPSPSVLLSHSSASLPSPPPSSSLYSVTTELPAPSSSASDSPPPSSPYPPPPLSPNLNPSDRPSSHSATNASVATVAGVAECDLFGGEWVRDEEGSGVLYRSETCPILTQSQDCRGNGRPDSDYEKWRWAPTGCPLLPRFRPRDFLSLLRSLTIAFVGDSVARNHMESLLCALWQVEEPMNRGSKKMQRWYFRSHDVTIIRIWSSWLVNTTDEAWDYAPANLTKLKLQEPDPSFMEVLPRINVLVISCGHWFTKRTAYLMDGKLVGGQVWSHNKLPKKRMKNTEAFAIAMKTSLKAIAKAPGFKGLTVLRTFSPDHYEGGAWDAGGSCTGKTRPAVGTEILRNPNTELMRALQLEALSEAKKQQPRDGTAEAAEFRVLDITPVSAARADGHPGPYRNRDPNKVTARRADGRPPPQDCLHWCMPGPIDTWNQLLQRMLEDHFSSSS